MPSRLTPRTAFLLGSAGCVVLWASHLWLGRLPSQRETYEARVTGSFVARVDEAGELAPRLPYWASEPGGGEGSVSLGPFPAPDRLRFAVRGDPGAAAGAVTLELELTKDRIPLAIAPAGAGWGTVDYEVPFGWRGRLVTLNARVGPGGAAPGLALSQPFGRGTGGERRYGLMETLLAWLANGLLYGAVFAAIARALARRQVVRPCWVALAACGLMALAGYAVFWAYFASPAIGRALSVGTLLAAWLAGVLPGGPFERRDREWLLAACAAGLIGSLYLGLLHLYPAHLDFYDLAANRFVVGSPGDGRLPFDFADLLYHGQRPRELGAGWLTSDRPPLQEGWQLIGWPATAAMGFADQTASATASVWFQLSWVLGLYGLLRSAGIPVARALSWAAAASLNGFFLFHTLFTWPKLSAGAFVCGAFGLWVLGGSPSALRGRVMGGLFAALAFLSHGGAAFSLIPFIPWIAWRLYRREVAPWILAALVFSLLAAPWLAYQRYYAPPGNRLLKWHLAGQTEIDARPLSQAVADAYRGLSWEQVLDRKARNLALQFNGDWAGDSPGPPGSVENRRMHEYYHAFWALGVWNLAAPLVAVSLLGGAFRRRLSESARWQAALGAWIAASMAAWCVLMFDGTVVPTGSLALMISMFALSAFWFELVGRWCLPCIAALQACALAATWIPGNAVVNGPLSAGAVALAAAATAAAAGLVLRSAGDARSSGEPS